jgi:hypothetical protein
MELEESPWASFQRGLIGQTRERIAGITRRVNYFIGTVRMNCGKIAEFPTLAAAREALASNLPAASGTGAVGGLRFSIWVAP